MNKYCKLKSGEIVVIWSDNVSDKTVDAYALSKERTYDVEVDVPDTYQYSDIEEMNINLPLQIY
jgi:hypothetical protein